MKRIKTENNHLLNNRKKQPEEYWENQKGRWIRKMIIINNEIVWRGITYNENYPKMLVDYFGKSKTSKTLKNKDTWEKTVVAWEYPTIPWFRALHNIPRSKRAYRVKNYEELREAIEIVSDKAEDMLIKNWLKGRYNAQVVKIVWQQHHWWTEKTETKTTEETLTDEQKQKLFDEYMRLWMEKWEILDGDKLNDESTTESI